MDITAPEIVFYDIGCNFCETAKRSLEEVACDKSLLLPIVKAIKDSQKGQTYDILVGLSGGVDSATALVRAVELGLRPLCFTLETGWNTKVADENIMRLVEGLNAELRQKALDRASAGEVMPMDDLNGIPLYRYVIDLPKFKELQAAYLQSGLKNIEVPTDHVLLAASMELATEHSIQYIVSGGNVATESIMPASWGYNARDLVQIKAVYRKAFGKELTGLPVCSLFMWNVYKWLCGIRTWYILDHYDYNRQASIEMLAQRFGYQDPGEKHCESYYTWWFQNFYLFEKFGIDKRKAHFSSLIISGQCTREEAMIWLQKNPEYPKLGIEDRAMRNYPRHEYTDYPNDERLYKAVAAFIRLWK